MSRHTDDDTWVGSAAAAGYRQISQAIGSSACVSPTGHNFAAIDLSGNLRLASAADPARVQTMVFPDKALHAVRWAAKGQHLLLSFSRPGQTAPSCGVFDLRSRSLTYSCDVASASAALSPCGQHLLFIDRSGQPQLTDLSAGSTIALACHLGMRDSIKLSAQKVHFSSSGKTMYVEASIPGVARQQYLLVYDRAARKPRDVQQALKVVYSPQREQVAYYRDRSMHLTDYSGAKPRYTTLHGQTWAMFTDDGTHLVTSPYHTCEAALRVDAKGHTVGKGRSEARAWSHDGKLQLARHYLHDSFDHDLVTADGVQTRPLPGLAFAKVQPAFKPGSSTYAAWLCDGEIALVDAALPRLRQRIALAGVGAADTSAPRSLKWTADGAHLLACTADALHVITPAPPAAAPRLLPSLCAALTPPV